VLVASSEPSLGLRQVGPSVPPFAAGGEFTLGAEEELLLVSQDGGFVQGGVDRVLAALPPCSSEAGTIGPEVFTNQIELNSAVCPDADRLAQCLGTLRQRLHQAGAWFMAAGVHPTADFGAVDLVRSPRYDRIVAEFGGLLRTPTSSLQIHVGLPDEEAALKAYRALRNRLPLLRGLAAASPWWHGRDSGLASARSAILSSYPRVRLPPVLHSYDEYVDRTVTVMAAAEVPDYTYLWWDLRPQPRLGTLEVRVMDAQPSLERVAGLAALVQGIARAGVEMPEQDDLPSDVLAENDFRATRYGLDARVIGPDGRIQCLRTVAQQSLQRARDVLRADGCDEPLSAVAAMTHQQPEAQRQRALVADRGLAGLVCDLTRRTTLTGVMT
jgi:glutamate---cysteine ligase / carboxylate-amine ligase